MEQYLKKSKELRKYAVRPAILFFAYLAVSAVQIFWILGHHEERWGWFRLRDQKWVSEKVSSRSDSYIWQASTRDLWAIDETPPSFLSMFESMDQPKRPPRHFDFLRWENSGWKRINLPNNRMYESTMENDRFYFELADGMHVYDPAKGWSRVSACPDFKEGRRNADVRFAERRAYLIDTSKLVYLDLESGSCGAVPLPEDPSNNTEVRLTPDVLFSAHGETWLKQRSVWRLEGEEWKEQRAGLEQTDITAHFLILKSDAQTVELSKDPESFEFDRASGRFIPTKPMPQEEEKPYFEYKLSPTETWRVDARSITAGDRTIASYSPPSEELTELIQIKVAPDGTIFAEWSKNLRDRKSSLLSTLLLVLPMLIFIAGAVASRTMTARTGFYEPNAALVPDAQRKFD